MRSRELQKYLSEVSIRSISDIDQRCRILRKKNEIRSGPRGLSAVHLDEADAALHVLCLASDKPADAHEVAKKLTFCDLADAQPFQDASAFRKMIGVEEHERVNLVVCLAFAMVEPSMDFVSFELSAHGAYAWVNIRLENRLQRLLFVFGTAEFTEDDFYTAESRSADNVFVVGGHILREIGRAIKEASTEGN